MTENENEVIEPEVVEEDPQISGVDSILTPQVLSFAKLVADGKSPTEAYRETHPETQSKARSLSRMAYQLAKNPKVREQITTLQEAVRLQIITEAPAAFGRIKELAENAKGEKVRLEANLEILDRAGLKPPQRIESIAVGLWGSLSAQDIKNMVRRRIENQT